MADFAQYLTVQAQGAVSQILSYLGAIIGAVWFLVIIFVGLRVLLGWLQSVSTR